MKTVQKNFRFLLFILLSRYVPCLPTCIDRTNDCRYEFGIWSDCDPCTLKRSRPIDVTAPPTEFGAICPKWYTAYESCNSSVACTQGRLCYDAEFKCVLTKRCISQSLQCNGADDCGDFSDEIGCGNRTRFTSKNPSIKIDDFPFSDLLSGGIDVTGADRLIGRLFDHRNFAAGGIRLAKSDFDSNLFYRMPTNFDQYVSQLQTSDQFNAQTYDSLSEFGESLEVRNDWSKTEKHKSGGWFNKKKTVKIFTHTELYKKLFSATNELKGSIIKISSVVKIGSFSLSKTLLILDPYFDRAIRILPSTINVHSYFQFFQQYGTHFIESGDIGGRYEHIYALDADLSKSSSETRHSVQDCFSRSTGRSVFFGVYRKNSANAKCATDQSGQMQSSSSAAIKYKKIANVEGGTLQPLSSLLVAVVRASNNISTVSSYPDWVASLERNPSILHKTLAAVCELFEFSNTVDIDLKIKICYDALTLYVNPYRSAACPPCSNRGIAVNINGICQCECAAGFTGIDCSRQTQSSSPNNSSAKLRTSFHANETDDDVFEKFNLIIDSSTGICLNPVPLQIKTLQALDISSAILKLFNGTIVLIQVSADNVAVVHYDRFLNSVESSNFKGLGSNLLDFDIDLHGNYWALHANGSTVKIENLSKDNTTANTATIIENPCLNWTASQFSRFTINCDKAIYVVCKYSTGAAIRVFQDGIAIRVHQLDLGTAKEIESIQAFGRILVVKDDLRISIYNVSNRLIISQFDLPSTDFQTFFYSQVFLDQDQNLISAQSAINQSAIKIFTPDKAIVDINLTQWENCTSVIAWQKLLYLICKHIKDNYWAILSYDYLK